MRIEKGNIVKVKDKRGMHWNQSGKMDHWMGKIVKIRKVLLPTIKIEDDTEEYSNSDGPGWTWRKTDFVQASNVEISEYLKYMDTMKVRKYGY